MTMQRRQFLKATATVAAALAAQGGLPLLAAKKRKPKGGTVWGRDNRFVEPSAIEPVTGYLPEFAPVTSGAMTGDFAAKYALVRHYGQTGGKAQNSDSGSLDIAFAGSTCTTSETRIKKDGLSNTVKTELTFQGEFNAAKSWTLESTITDRPETRLVEQGNWDGKTMTAKAKSWTNNYPTGPLLIGRWALLPLLASGKLKTKPLAFDLLDECTVRRDQTLRYMGEIEIPVKGGTATLDSYAHTGWGITPTHYLVDNEARVQLITMSTVNWALNTIGKRYDREPEEKKQ